MQISGTSRIMVGSNPWYRPPRPSCLTMLWAPCAPVSCACRSAQCVQPAALETRWPDVKPTSLPSASRHMLLQIKPEASAKGLTIDASSHSSPKLTRLAVQLCNGLLLISATLLPIIEVLKQLRCLCRLQTCPDSGLSIRWHHRTCLLEDATI